MIVSLTISRRDWWPEDLVTGHHHGKLVNQARSHVAEGTRARIMLVIDASVELEDSCSFREFISPHPH